MALNQNSVLLLVLGINVKQRCTDDRSVTLEQATVDVRRAADRKQDGRLELLDVQARIGDLSRRQDRDVRRKPLPIVNAVPRHPIEAGLRGSMLRFERFALSAL